MPMRNQQEDTSHGRYGWKTIPIARIQKKGQMLEESREVTGENRETELTATIKKKRKKK